MSDIDIQAVEEKAELMRLSMQVRTVCMGVCVCVCMPCVLTSELNLSDGSGDSN